MSAASITFHVPADAEGLRLDQCLARHVPALSRRTARVALSIGAVFVDRKRVKVAGRAVRTGQRITVHLGGAFQRAVSGSPSAEATPQPQLLHEDDDIVVLDKPAGMLSAPTPEGDQNDVQAWLRRQARRAQLFVVHRLDLHTSGVMVYAKTARANRHLSALFRHHDLRRQYQVFAAGQLTWDERRVDLPLHGRRAVTHLRCEAQYANFARLQAELETGRTHQIRLHLRALGHPVLADPRYSTRQRWHPPRLALHAALLEFRHLDQRLHHFETPLPEDLAQWLDSQRDARPPDPPRS